jgi:hypothetical protein
VTDAITFALTKLHDDVVAAIGDGVAGTWDAPIFTGTGTAIFTIDAASSPAAAYAVRVRIVTGGTVGVVGIVYAVSTDGGATYGPDTDLDTDDFINVPGAVKFLLDDDIVPHGTLDADDVCDVVTYAPTDAPPQPFGWREVAKQLETTTRIVWVPGDDASGKAGEVATARFPGRTPRPLWTLRERFTCYIEARDTAAPEDERAQYVAARTLLDAWLGAVYDVAHGTVVLDEPVWQNEKNVRRAGAAFRVTGTIQAMVPEQARPVTVFVPPPVGFKAQVDVLDASETTEN